MIKQLLLLCAALSLAGCGSTVVREAKVFKTELMWFARASTEQAAQLRHFVAAHCVCNEGKTAFTDPNCQQSARLLLMAESRTDWHRQMALFNAQAIEKRPPKVPPEMPNVTTLCKESEETP